VGVRWVGLPEGEGRSVWLDPCSDQSLEYQERFFHYLIFQMDTFAGGRSARPVNRLSLYIIPAMPHIIFHQLLLVPKKSQGASNQKIVPVEF
jgi:hypothetical protein